MSGDQPTPPPGASVFVEYTVSPDALPPSLRTRVPAGDGVYVVARDGDAPPAGCLIGRLPQGEFLYLIDPIGEDEEGTTIYAGWAILGPEPVIETRFEA